MKKIILMCLFGLMFSQSIQTKQVEVTITDFSDINLYELIDNPISGNYLFELAEVTNTGNTRAEIAFTNFPIMGANWHSLVRVFIEENLEIYILNISPITINDEHKFIIHNPWDAMMYPYNFDSGELVLTFWVTGMFEDEGVGLQGDMNDDNFLDVLDIVAMVNIIVAE